VTCNVMASDTVRASVFGAQDHALEKVPYPIATRQLTINAGFSWQPLIIRGTSPCL